MWFAEQRTVRAALLPDRAVLLPPAGAAITCEAGAAASDVAPWSAALAALLQGLQASGLRRGSVRLTLGAAFVRWQLVDWPASVGAPAELDAAVRLRLRAVHGAAVAGWHILHGDGPPGQAVPACAVDTALLQALRRELAAAGWRLHSLQPYAAATLDHWRHHWRRGAAWVAVVEPGHLTLALFEGGRWRGLRSVRCEGQDEAAWQAQLPALQAQMGLQMGQATGQETGLKTGLKAASQPAGAAPVRMYLIGPTAGAAAPPAWQGLVPAGAPARREGLARLAWGH